MTDGPNKFDLTRFLTAHGIEWTTDGPVVTSKCVGVKCPWCTDTSFHLGIFRDKFNFTCWRCGRKGPLWKLTQELVGMGRDELEALISDGMELLEEPAVDRIRRVFGEPDITAPADKPEAALEVPPSFPIEPGGHKLPRLLKQFLGKRRFTVADCARYSAHMCVHPGSRWYNRLVLPVFAYGQMVSLVGRSLSGGTPKYLNAGGINIKQYLYGQDLWPGGRLWLVEGPLDVWRMGDRACASFGAYLTDAQRSLIYQMNPAELVVAWDADAWQQALGVGRFFAPLLPRVKVLRLPEGGDPDSLGRKKMLELAATAKHL